MQANSDERSVKKHLTSYWTHFWHWLIAPHAEILREEERKQAELLSSMLIAVISVGSLIVLYYIITTERRALGEADTWLMIGGIVFSILLFFASRANKTKEAAFGVIVTQIILFVASFYMPTSLDNMLYYTLVPVLLTAIFFNVRQVMLTTAAVVTSATGLMFLFPQADRHTVLNWAIFFIFTTVIIIIFMQHYKHMEAIRRRRLEVANYKLRESEALLERRVEARTLELSEARDKAETAQKEAEASNRAKSQFLASMSHELRTPMNAILNFTEMTALGMVGPVNEQQKDILNKSLDSGRHLLALINDILDITKIHSGALTLFIEDDVDLYAEVDKVIDATKTLIGDKPVQFIYEIEPDIPPISCDARRVRQILLNLLSNAAKFTDDGNITLSLKRHEGMLFFSVADTGSGISHEQQEIIFEPFVQTEKGLQHTQGTGLGLPISKQLAEAHGGKLWVESELGAGSTFYVMLPLTPNNGRSPHPSSQPAKILQTDRLGQGAA